VDPMRLFVTGGSGFLGSFVVRRALSDGHQVLALARSEKAAATLTGLGAEPVAGDLDDLRSVDDAFAHAADQGAETLLNLASLGFGHAPVVVAAAEEAGMTRAVFVSTTAVATALPAPSKQVRLAAEEVIRDSGLDWTMIRPTMIYGAPGDRNIARLLALLRHSPVIFVPGGGERLQQPVHVDDLAAALLAAATCPKAIGRVYDVAGPEPLTFRQLLVEASQAVGRGPRLVPVPLRPSLWALGLYEKAVTRPRLKVEQLERLAEDKAFDITAAVEDLGYRPRAFRTGVREEARALWT